MKLEGAYLEAWKSYVNEILERPEGSEKALYYLFQFPRVFAKYSIEV